MIIHLTISSTEDWVSHFGGSYGLTPKERQVLVAFINLAKENPNVDVFNTYFRKIASRKVNMSGNYDINGYVKSLADKQALVKTEYSYVFPTLLVPPSPLPTQVVFFINQSLLDQ